MSAKIVTKPKYSMARKKKPFNFLGLPSELRNEIYGYHFVNCFTAYGRLKGIHRPKQYNAYTRIFLVNRQIYEEASSMFYNNIFPELPFHLADLNCLYSLATIPAKYPDCSGRFRFRVDARSNASDSGPFHYIVNKITTEIGLGRFWKMYTAFDKLTEHTGGTSSANSRLIGEIDHVDLEGHKIHIKWDMDCWRRSLGWLRHRCNYLEVEGNIGALLSLFPPPERKICLDDSDEYDDPDECNNSKDSNDSDQ